MKLSRLFKYWTLQVFSPDKLVRHKYVSFKELLRHDKRSLELITDLEDIQHLGAPVDWARVARLGRALIWSVGSLIRALVAMHPGAYGDLERRFDTLASSLMDAIFLPAGESAPPYTLTRAEAAQEPDLAGDKAHTLSRVVTATGFPSPPGFTITTRAFHLFLAHNDLRHRLDELLAEVHLDDWERLEALSREMVAMVREGEVPAAVRQDVQKRLAELHSRERTGLFSLRSSAVREEGDISFAGQYASVLQVSAEDLLEAYKQVLASKYAPRALAYRLRSGLPDQETPMAVLVMEMVDARVSGVIYTRDRETAEGSSDCLAVYAVPGLGHRLVDGSAEPEVHYFTREPQPRFLKSISGPTCPVELPEKACLAPATAGPLAGWGMRLEELAGSPQDIEWCQDRQGALYILQARPLATGTPAVGPGPEESAPSPPDLPVLLEGGVTASSGVGTGKVCVIQNETELGEVPDGSVLVSPTLSPSLAAVLGRLRAVVAEGGSRASHFASVAREFGLPVLVAVPAAIKLLSPGLVVTVDAGRRRIYEGEVGVRRQEPYKSLFHPAAPFLAHLKKVMEVVTPLTLLDPASPEFAPENCANLHDLVRFAHEKGMAEMFSLVGRSGRGLGRARQLATDLPLIMYVLDLEGGIAPEAAAQKTVDPQSITSPLMQACWAGLTHPEVVWPKGLILTDWEEVDRISASILSFKSALLASYALVAREYLHLVLRFGYHFAVLDALCGEAPEANYIAFRFKGGGGNYENRLRRVELMEEILTWAGFAVKTRGDLLDARFDRHPCETTLARLTLLGILQGKTQLLDMALDSDTQVQEMVEAFKASHGNYVQQSSATRAP
jgi:pyruvate,water dikinase